MSTFVGIIKENKMFKGRESRISKIVKDSRVSTFNGLNTHS